MRPRLLDLMCCQGGASAGYDRAGFAVLGVDVERQPLYPYAFVRAEALSTLPGIIAAYRPLAVHASPPCRDHSALAAMRGVTGTGWLLARTVAALEATGLPYVVENVDRAELPGAFTLCARSLGIPYLRRHRKFVTNVPVLVPPCTCSPGQLTYTVAGSIRHSDTRETNGRAWRPGRDTARRIMGTPWMDSRGLRQAIPPAYTQLIGEWLLAELGVAA